MFTGVDFISEESRQFAECWHGLPKDGLLPSRNDFDPMEIAKMLPGVCLYEVICSSRIKIRLAGTGVTAIYGREITGGNFLDLWPADLRTTAGRVLRVMLEQPCGLVATLAGRTGSGAEIPNVSVGFPILDRAGQASMLLFHTSNMEIPHLHDPDDDPIVNLELTRRHFVDIGAGRPDFQEPKDGA